MFQSAVPRTAPGVSGGRNNGEEEDLDGEEDNDLSHECIVYMVCYK